VEFAIFAAPLRQRDAVEMETPAFLATAWSVDAVRGGTTVFMSIGVPDATRTRSQVIYDGLPPSDGFNRSSPGRAKSTGNFVAELSNAFVGK
jgi:hypothetical protein